MITRLFFIRLLIIKFYRKRNYTFIHEINYRIEQDYSPWWNNFFCFYSRSFIASSKLWRRDVIIYFFYRSIKLSSEMRWKLIFLSLHRFSYRVNWSAESKYVISSPDQLSCRMRSGPEKKYLIFFSRSFIVSIEIRCRDEIFKFFLSIDYLSKQFPNCRE